MLWRCWVASSVLFGPVALAASLPASPTFYKDVAPILQACCVQCQRAGEIAPMAFTAYAESRRWPAAVKEAVRLRKMPPWPADAPPGHFSNDWRLSDRQVDTTRRWAEAHAPAGDPRDAPPAQAFTQLAQGCAPRAAREVAHHDAHIE